MMKNNYKITKNNKYNKYSLIKTDISLNMKKKKDKDSMGTIKFYNDDLIDKVIKKNTDNRFKKLLELIVSVSEEGNPPDGLMLCLDETSKFRLEVNNKYKKYLSKKQMEIIMKKIELIEKDLKNKLMALAIIKRKIMEANSIDYRENEEEIERHHAR